MTFPAIVIATLALFVGISLTSYFFFLLVGALKGAPYIATSHNIVEEILVRAKLKPGQTFLELGSGDGRVSRFAAEYYGVRAVGVEIHPILVLYANIVSRLRHIQATFIVGSFYVTNLSNYDVIFIFLLPETLNKLVSRLQDETKRPVLIISHGFAIPSLDRFLVDSISRKRFPTYYYRLTG